MIRRALLSIALIAGLACADAPIIASTTYVDASFAQDYSVTMSPMYPDAAATAEELAGAVANQLTTSGANKVRFLDADGTVISTQYVPVGGSAVLPPTPHLDTALTFDGWVGASSNIQAPIDIIASYHPTDGYTHYNINLNSITGLTTTVYFYKNDNSTLTVDWGDGTVVTSTATGNATLSHTFATAGSYSVRAAITSGSGYSQMGQGTSTTQVFGPTQLDILQSVWMRASQSAVAAYAFQGYRSLDYVIGSGVTSIGTSAFQNCYSATSFSFPLATSIGAYAFQGCVAATSFSFPLATSIGTSAFQNCRKLLTVTFGSPSISLVDSYAFDGDYALNSITFASTVPPALTSTNAFTLNSFATIYVPTASVAAYKAATNWASFSTRIVGY